MPKDYAEKWGVLTVMSAPEFFGEGIFGVDEHSIKTQERCIAERTQFVELHRL